MRLFDLLSIVEWGGKSKMKKMSKAALGLLAAGTMMASFPAPAPLPRQQL
ncbi:hypothetical protein [Amycolatopsis sp. NPDC051903]